MAIALEKIGDTNTLATGYTHMASFESSDLSASTGAQATDVTYGGSQLAGLIKGAAIVVEELVSADVSTGSDVSDATIALGDNADPNGFVVEANCFTGDTNNLIFQNNGVLLDGQTSSEHIVTAVDVTSNGTGNGFGNATKGKFKIFLEYYPTAGEHYSG